MKCDPPADSDSWARVHAVAFACVFAIPAGSVLFYSIAEQIGPAITGAAGLMMFALSMGLAAFAPSGSPALRSFSYIHPRHMNPPVIHSPLLGRGVLCFFLAIGVGAVEWIVVPVPGLTALALALVAAVVLIRGFLLERGR